MRWSRLRGPAAAGGPDAASEQPRAAAGRAERQPSPQRQRHGHQGERPPARHSTGGDGAAPGRPLRRAGPAEGSAAVAPLGHRGREGGLSFGVCGASPLPGPAPRRREGRRGLPPCRAALGPRRRPAARRARRGSAGSEVVFCWISASRLARRGCGHGKRLEAGLVPPRAPALRLPGCAEGRPERCWARRPGCPPRAPPPARLVDAGVPRAATGTAGVRQRSG